MYKTIKGIYKKGQIILKEPIDFNDDEIEILVTFLKEKITDKESANSAHDILYSMGERAGTGTIADASENHDQILYSKKQK